MYSQNISQKIYVSLLCIGNIRKILLYSCQNLNLNYFVTLMDEVPFHSNFLLILKIIRLVSNIFSFIIIILFMTDIAK